MTSATVSGAISVLAPEIMISPISFLAFLIADRCFLGAIFEIAPRIVPVSIGMATRATVEAAVLTGFKEGFAAFQPAAIGRKLI